MEPARRRPGDVVATPSWSTPSGPARSSRCWPPPSAGSWCCAGRRFAGHTLARRRLPRRVRRGAGRRRPPASATSRFCVAAALVIALIPGAGQGRGEESALTGTVQAFPLACGFLFVALYKGFLGGVDALLFGSFLGITDGQVVLLAVVAAVVLAVLAAVGRPLLFASVDPSGRRRPRRAGPGAGHRLPGAARRRRRRGQPDHRHAAGLRAAGDAGRHRPTAHRPPRGRACRWPCSSRSRPPGSG